MGSTTPMERTGEVLGRAPLRAREAASGMKRPAMALRLAPGLVPTSRSGMRCTPAPWQTRTMIKGKSETNRQETSLAAGADGVPRRGEWRTGGTEQEQRAGGASGDVRRVREPIPRATRTQFGRRRAAIQTPRTQLGRRRAATRPT